MSCAPESAKANQERAQSGAQDTEASANIQQLDTKGACSIIADRAKSLYEQEGEQPQTDKGRADLESYCESAVQYADPKNRSSSLAFSLLESLVERGNGSTVLLTRVHPGRDAESAINITRSGDRFQVGVLTTSGSARDETRFDVRALNPERDKVVATGTFASFGPDGIIDKTYLYADSLDAILVNAMNSQLASGKE